MHIIDQAEAERRKRAQILESEGDRQSKINVAEGDKAQVILSSEAAKQDAINRATGQAHMNCPWTATSCNHVLELDTAALSVLGQGRGAMSSIYQHVDIFGKKIFWMPITLISCCAQ